MAAKPIQGRAVSRPNTPWLPPGGSAITLQQYSRPAIEVVPATLFAAHRLCPQTHRNARHPRSRHPGQPRGIDGRTRRCWWITESEISIAADTTPSNNILPNLPKVQQPSCRYTNTAVQTRRTTGIWHLTELATYLRSVGRTACLLTAPPLNMPGAAGSPVNPIATVQPRKHTGNSCPPHHLYLNAS